MRKKRIDNQITRFLLNVAQKGMVKASTTFDFMSGKVVSD